jgi:hypothetical protein
MHYVTNEDALRMQISTLEKTIATAAQEGKTKQTIIDSQNASLRDYRTRDINHVYEISVLREENHRLQKMLLTCYAVALSMIVMGLCLVLASIFKTG